MTERKHKGLYSLYLSAHLTGRGWVTTRVLYDEADEFKGVTLLKSREDTSALLHSFTKQGLVESRPFDGRGNEYQLTDDGLMLLEDLGTPAGIDQDNL